MFNSPLSQITAAPVAATPNDIDRLLASEFGSPYEVTFRLFVVASVGIAFSYTTPGDLRGYVWAATYMAGLALTYFLAKSVTKRPTAIGRGGVYAAHTITALIFFSLPIQLLTTGVTIQAFCAGVGLASLFIFTIWRKEPPAFVLPLDIFFATLTAGGLLWRFYPLAETTIAQGTVLLLTFTMLVYFSMTLVITRRDQRRLRLAAERSVQAQKMEALGRLSGGIAHDFNNILTVIQGNLELFREIGDSSEKSALVADAHLSALRASGLVRQLLSFARQAPLAPKPISAQELMGDVHAMTKRLLPASITLDVAKVPPELRVRTDADALLSALLNLIINARDAIDGRGAIHLSVTAIAGPGTHELGLPANDRGYIGFHITDDGPGLPQAALGKIFEPFFTTKPVGEGAGLGLPSAKGFAEQSGGGLTVESEPGHTTFSIYLPRAQHRA